MTPHDATAFASTIDALLGDDTRRQALGRSAQAFVRDRFAWPRIAEEYVRLFNAAIHSASPVRSAGDGSR